MKKLLVLSAAILIFFYSNATVIAQDAPDCGQVNRDCCLSSAPACSGDLVCFNATCRNSDEVPRTSAQTSVGCEDLGEDYISTGIGCIPFGDNNLIAGFFLRWGLGIAGGVALLLIGFAGFKIATSQGDPKRLQGGQELLLSAIGGLLMVVLSVFLLRFIGVDILGIF